ncbi:hypothetical protein WN944_009457 [Citrus x changshan-huyou]|uniref:Uncharacterized protein n=1 Tax=Citrus x changshan-huyou TaxID=2935761 RepID=A0AAP0MPT4_9ROSI
MCHKEPFDMMGNGYKMILQNQAQVIKNPLPALVLACYYLISFSPQSPPRRRHNNHRKCDLRSSTSKDKQVRPQKPKHRRCLTPHVGNFGYLRFINLVDNNFRGEIPEEKQLVGAVPPELGYLSKLMKLFIGENHLSGQLPDFIGNPSAIQVMIFKENSSEGKIPNTLSNLRSLFYVNINRNEFSGLIPSFIFDISSLKWNFLPENSFTEPSTVTNEFSSSNMIGQGSFGSVYKGILGEKWTAGYSEG